MTTEATTGPLADATRDARELLARCDELAAISSSTTGIERVYLSPQHAEAHARAAEWMAEAGMAVRQDAAGNLVGRLEGGRPGLPALLLGSHLDTVPAAGRYDGILGVLSAIAVVRRLAPRAATLPFAVEVVAFGDEEGTRFGTTLLGSAAVAGAWRDEWWDLTDRDGVTLRAAFERFGLDPARIGEANRDGEVFAYLETHIEQGPRLEDLGLPLGVVTGIAAARRMSLTFHGEARHCATPYDRRHDALLGAAEAVVAIESAARSLGAMATVGRIEVAPGAVNVIPGTATLSLDLRAETDESRDAALDAILKRLAEICAELGLTLERHDTHRAPAVLCDARLQEAIAEAVGSLAPEGAAGPIPRLFSVAGHDAMAVAGIAPVGMTFVRCEGGISHHADEAVTLEDVVAAVDALERTVEVLACAQASSSPRSS
ncbi:allantoate amidohydrolase [Leifsonia sp. AG29]|uniref:allantoate amidohydrolase n=1 Tax=Leifsonia sp. AG29 TaxID=2598860 RepID=UPI00131CAE28|nr:allantoate amidohydrolase [Leifsonia sp. AG29]